MLSPGQTLSSVVVVNESIVAISNRHSVYQYLYFTLPLAFWIFI